jgi:arginase
VQADFILVPYDSARRGFRMGAGPLHLARTGIARELARFGHDVALLHVELDAQPADEPAAAFALAERIGARVRAARAAGRLPPVLAGNCNSALGVVAALGPERAAVCWFDAHADFNTPATSTSGFLDGMALATLTGRCFADAAASLPGFVPIDDARVLLLGARAIDPGEQRLLAASRVASIPAAALREEGVEPALSRRLALLAASVEGAYLHIDLDVLDPGVAAVNGFAADGGLRLDELLACIELIGARLPIRAAALSAYDPAFDADGRARQAAFDVAACVLRSAG